MVNRNENNSENEARNLQRRAVRTPGECITDEILRFRLSVMRDENATAAERLRAAGDIERTIAPETPGSGRFELPARSLGRAFVDVNRNIKPNGSYVFSGGRGSGKSSFIALKIVELLKNNDNLHACIVRKVAATLRDSVYAQMCWAIGELGLNAEFTFRQSPLEIVRNSTGQTVYFRGCDDASKLKSLKPPFGYVGILWCEELDQLSGEEELRSIVQSVLRGGSETYEFSSFNPPKSRQAWVNRLDAPAVDGKSGEDSIIRHKSTYLDMPPEWLGERFITDAERLRVSDPAAYEHEYLGAANGAGGLVFEHVEVREISDDEIALCDRIMQGLDFGWYPDPTSFLRTHWDSRRSKILLLDELYQKKCPISRVAEWISERGYGDYPVICDSAEPRSIAELRCRGVGAVAAKKGPGSIESGFKWLLSQTLVVDPKRTPCAYREICEYEYARTADGEVKPGFPDRGDHAISALRYAYERAWRYAD